MVVDLNTTDFLEDLLKSTKDLQLTTILAAVTDALRLRIAGLTKDLVHVKVDDWPDWKCIFVICEVPLYRPNGNMAAARTVLLYCKTKEYLTSTFLQNQKEVYLNHNTVYVLDPCLMEKGSSGIFENDRIRSSPPFKGFFIEPNAVPSETMAKYLTLPEGYSLESIKPEDIDVIHSNWASLLKPSRDIFEFYVTALPNACIRDVAGTCVTWALTNPWGYGPHLFTLPGHRRHGLGRVVLMQFATRSEKYKMLNVAAVLPSNAPSMNLFQNTEGIFPLEGQIVAILHTPDS